MKNSRSLDINKIFETEVDDDLSAFVDYIIILKRITDSNSFKEKLFPRLQQIAGYERLKKRVEIERTNFYDSENEEHERTLLNVCKKVLYLLQTV